MKRIAVLLVLAAACTSPLTVADRGDGAADDAATVEDAAFPDASLDVGLGLEDAPLSDPTDAADADATAAPDAPLDAADGG